MTEQTSSQPGRFYKNPQAWAAAGLVLSFFLPWFSNPQLTGSGYNIGVFLRFFSVLAPVAGIITVVAYLVLAGGILIMILNLSGKPSGLVSLITAMGPLVMLIVLTLRSPLIMGQIQIGVILALAAAAVLLISGANGK